MPRPKNEVPTKRVTVMFTQTVLDDLDQAALDARKETGASVDRSALIAAVIESADLPKVALEVAKGWR